MSDSGASIRVDAEDSRVDILHLTSAHNVYDTRIFVKEACTLANAGYRVAIAGPGDKASQQTTNCVEIYTLPRPKGRFGRFTSFAKQLYAFVIKTKPRVIHIHDPDLLFLARLITLRGMKIVYDVHEEFPKAVLSRNWLGPRVVRHAASGLVGRLEHSATRWADGFVLADTQLADRFPSDKSVVIRNYLDMSEWLPLPNPKPPASNDLRCIYVGDITEPRGLSRMCDAIHAASMAGIDVTLDLVGHITDAHRTTIENHPAAGKIVLHGWGTRALVTEKMAAANIAFCLLEPTPAYREALPVKVLEYVVSGLQVVATDLSRLQQETPLADALQFVAWDATPDELASAIARASSANVTQKSRMQQVVTDQYDWADEASRLIEFYDTLLGKGST